MKEMALLEHAQALADVGGMEKPEGLAWGMKAVAPDLTAYGGFRWPWPGGWAKSTNVAENNRGPCPRREGDGLCVAKTWHGMRFAVAPSTTLLLIGYIPSDVLGEDAEKLRVSRAYVRDVIAGERLIREHGRGAYLSGAYLSGAYLSRADLSGADLSGADLSRAYLSGANLSGAYLSRADLSGADLSGAYLSRANLSGAYLSRANLSGAYLSRANLSDADLSDADLFGANLSDANLFGANLSDANLSRAGLFGANLRRAWANERTEFPEGFDAKKAGVRIERG